MALGALKRRLPSDILRFGEKPSPSGPGTPLADSERSVSVWQYRDSTPFSG
jgi:hypothetical protein